MLSKNLRKQLGYLLWLERGNNEKNIKWVSQKTGITVLSVDFIEHGKGHFNWKLYERMLDLYGKEVQITLVEKEKE